MGSFIGDTFINSTLPQCPSTHHCQYRHNRVSYAHNLEKTQVTPLIQTRRRDPKIDRVSANTEHNTPARHPTTPTTAKKSHIPPHLQSHDTPGLTHPTTLAPIAYKPYHNTRGTSNWRIGLCFSTVPKITPPHPRPTTASTNTNPTTNRQQQPLARNVGRTGLTLPHPQLSHPWPLHTPTRATRPQ